MKKKIDIVMIIVALITLIIAMSIVVYVNISKQASSEEIEGIVMEDIIEETNIAEKSKFAEYFETEIIPKVWTVVFALSGTLVAIVAFIGRIKAISTNVTEVIKRMVTKEDDFDGAKKELKGALAEVVEMKEELNDLQDTIKSLKDMITIFACNNTDMVITGQAKAICEVFDEKKN